jgi:hypothetical protein
VADLVNAGISAGRGDFVGAGFNLASSLPGLGDAFAAGKIATAAVGVAVAKSASHAVSSTAATAAKVEAAVVKETTTVIGRVKDLEKLGPGEKSLLDRLPDLGSPKANWEQNSGVLRQEMNRGLPIRDASVGDNSGQFLNAERNLLRDRGWTFDGSYWKPPAH